MVLGGKVVAAVKPAEEESLFRDDDDDDEKEKENEPDGDCFCVCFCDDEEEGEQSNRVVSIAKAEPKKEEKKVEEVAGEEDEEEEGLIDPQEELRSQCGEKKECTALKEKLDACNARVQSRSKTAETCVEELIDFMHCIDHCASKTLFSKLK